MGIFLMATVGQCVRLGMAIVIIALISLVLYQFSSRAQASSNASFNASFTASANAASANGAVAAGPLSR